MIRAISLRLALLLVGLAIPGCVCFRPGAEFNPGCKVLNIVVSCAAPAAVTGFGTLINGVTPAISGQSVDWGAIANLEKQYGTQALMCALNQAAVIAAGAVGAPPAAAPQGVDPGAVAKLQSNKDSVKKNVDNIYAKRRVIIGGGLTS